METLLSFFSNIDWYEIWLASIDTLIMLGGSLLFTVLLGLPLGILLFLCSANCWNRKPCIRPCRSW